MRRFMCSAFCFAALAVPQIGNAQVFGYETPPPAVTAAGAPWQLSGEPIFHAGSYYDPTGPTVFFDGRVMVRTDTWLGVPLYEDSTREPYSVVYVPIGGNVMRPYARRTEDELARTTGWRTPESAVAQDYALLSQPDTGRVPTAAVDSDYVWIAVPASALGRVIGSTPPPDTDAFVPHGVVSVPSAAQDRAGAADNAGAGLWIDFDNARWYSSGRAVDYDAARFEPAGDYRGFPVFRDRSAPADRIYVTTVHDGPLAPFARR